MKRKIYERMLDWKKTSKGKTAILIDGARRVGKSYIAEEFARNEYRSYILIDFFKVDDDVKELFNHYLNDLDAFFQSLSAIYGKKLYERESLIIFDEVQFFPRARAAIKYLVADGRYDYIETGSLMSIKENVSNILIPSEERHFKLYPMDFEEFLWALNDETLMPVIKSCFEQKKPMGQAVHRKALTRFREYLIVGGMPQAVKEYIDTHDFDAVDAVKRDVLTLYREDIMKHARNYAYKVERIFDEIPSQLSKHEKKFVLASLGSGARFREYENAFMWLEDAMIVNVCWNSTEPNIGLKLSRDNATMKIYMADTGLLISHAFDENGLTSNEIYKKILLGKLEVNEGMIFENIVAQMFATSGHKLYFYSNPSREDKDLRMEIDFLLSKSKTTSRHNVSPVEVKSGKRYTFSSLKKFRQQYKEQLHTAYILHVDDLKVADDIVYLPVYMAGLL